MFRPNPERPINIRHLAVEYPQPREELPFDPERDITEEDWKEMRKFTKSLGRDRAGFCICASQMRILEPSIDFGLDPETLRKMCDAVLASIQQGREDWRRFIRMAADIKLLDDTVDFGITEDTIYEGGKKILANKYNPHGAVDTATHVASFAFDMKILAPSMELAITSEDQEKLREELRSEERRVGK